MARPRLLVATTVHHADDNRIREKTIRSLAHAFDVTYAARLPAPQDDSGFTFVPLRGGRLRRVLRASWIMFTGGHDVVSIHDPELLPFALLAQWGARIQVVFDMHEDVPAQISTKEWISPILRRPTAMLAGWMLRAAETRMHFTLAEPDYQRRLRRTHVVLRNTLRVEGLPNVTAARERRAIYVGDITRQRGALQAIEASGALGVPLVMVGPTHDFDGELQRLAERSRARLVLTGRLPHAEAMEWVASSSIALSPLHDTANYRESIPTKILEYLALGVPVVASDLPATRRLVEGLSAVHLVSPGSVSALVEGMHRALNPIELEAAIAQAEDIRRTHVWDDDELSSLYLDLV